MSRSRNVCARIAQQDKAIAQRQKEFAQNQKEFAQHQKEFDNLHEQRRKMERELAEADAHGEELKKKNEEMGERFEQGMAELAQQIVEHEAEDGGLVLKEVLKDCEDAGEPGAKVGAVLVEKVKVARIKQAKTVKANHEQATEPTKEYLQLDCAIRKIEEAKRKTKELEAELKELRRV